LKDKIILTDCDGVLCDWEHSFDRWMNRHGYKIVNDGLYKMDEKYEIPRNEAQRLIRMFNESATIRRLPPFRDAIKYVKKLHEEHGYIFHVITSMSDDEYAQHLRTKNLSELFGPSVFDKFVYLDCGADKDEALAKYENTGCWWIEDKPDNARVGKYFGLNPLLMSHEHNADDKDIPRVLNWRNIHDVILGYDI